MRHLATRTIPRVGFNGLRNLMPTLHVANRALPVNIPMFARGTARINAFFSDAFALIAVVIRLTPFVLQMPAFATGTVPGMRIHRGLAPVFSVTAVTEPIAAVTGTVERMRVLTLRTVPAVFAGYRIGNGVRRGAMSASPASFTGLHIVIAMCVFVCRAIKAVLA